MKIAAKEIGSVALLTPSDPEAEEWLRDNCEHEPWQWAGNSLAVDSNRAPEILRGFADRGGSYVVA